MTMAAVYSIRNFVMLIFFVIDLCCGLSIIELMKKEPEVRFIARYITNNTVLANIYNKENITVFLPSNDAYFNMNESKFDYPRDDVQTWTRILQYGALDGAIYLDDMTENTHHPTHLGSNRYIYFNYYPITSTSGYHTVNGARIVRGNIRGDNGIVHIVDRVIAPYCSYKTLPDYLESPDIRFYSFSSIIKARIVVPELARQTNRSDFFFTSFSPNDSYLYPMPKYGQDQLFENWILLQQVYKAHLIPNSVQFIPTHGPIPDFTTVQGDKLSFTRYNGEVYVSNNKVRAKIVQANIAVSNGVLHVIDDLLHFVYQTIMQRLEYVPEAKAMLEYMKELPQDIKDRLNSVQNETFTVFVPTLKAFAKIPETQQQELRRTDEEGLKTLNYLIQGHIIAGKEITSKDLESDQTLTTIDDKIVSIIHVHGETYIESGTVRAKIEVMDIGCTNGVIHLISNVLFMRNFTLWEAMENIPLISKMFSFAMRYPDIEESMISDNTGPRTVFIASNDVLNQANLTYLKSFPYIVHEAMKGQIVQGIHMSSDIARSIQVGTMAGKTLTLYKEKESGEFYVEGSHVRARVIVKDIWCSNGVMHIVDDVLHLPIRSVLQELSRRPELTFTYGMIDAVQAVEEKLSNLSENFTLFIPHNSAFTKLQWSTIDDVLKDIPLAKKMLECHIVSGVAKYIDEIRDGEMLQADENDIYLIRNKGHVFVINNNLWARILTPDIPASNGRIHIIDTIFSLPYMSVAEALENMEELQPFQDLMSLVPDFNDLITSKDNRKMTLFIPSGKYIESLGYNQIDRIQKSPKILRRLYAGHVLPQMRFDDAFLRKYPETDYVSRSALNVTFTISRSGPVSVIDTGYEKHEIDLVRRGFAFTNGVIYIIDSFLNYCPLNLLERLRDEVTVREAIGLLDLLVTPNVTDLLQRDDVMFTFLAPSDISRNLGEFNDFAKSSDWDREEKLTVFWRHVINDSEVTYSDLKQGYIRPEILPNDVTLQRDNGDVRFGWENIQGRIIKSNLLASNGIIHVIDMFLYEDMTSTTTTRRTYPPYPSQPRSTPTTANAQPVQGAVPMRHENMVVLLTLVLSWTLSKIIS